MSSIKALVFEGHDGPQPYRWTEIPVPAEPPEGGVLIRTHAASMCPRRDFICSPGLRSKSRGGAAVGPRVVGTEVAGIVERVVGPQQSKMIAPGEPVCAYVGGGAMAEYVWARPERCVPLHKMVPGRFDWAEAAAIPVQAMSAFFALHCRGKLESGDVVLISGADHALGPTLVRWAVAHKAWVVASAATPEAARRIEAWGAMACFEMSSCALPGGHGAAGPEAGPIPDEEDPRPSLAERVLAHTDGRPVDLIVDLDGGEGFDALVGLTAPFGHIVSLAECPRAVVHVAELVRRSATVSGFVMKEMLDRPDILCAVMKPLRQKLLDGAFSPLVRRIRPEDAAEFLRSGLPADDGSRAVCVFNAE